MTVSTLDILSFKYILGTLGLLADDLGCFIWFEDGDRVAPALKFGCSLDDGFDATCFGTECFFNGFSPDLELEPSLDPAWFWAGFLDPDWLWAGSKSPIILEPASALSVKKLKIDQNQSIQLSNKSNSFFSTNVWWPILSWGSMSQIKL